MAHLSHVTETEYMPKVILLLALLFGASACTSLVPSDGPLLKQVASVKEDDDGFVYGTVNLDKFAVSSLSKHDYYPLSSKFGLDNRTTGGQIGVGDVLTITIFEAGPDGLFSTTDKKSVELRMTVQNNGRISIPFDGTVKASGRSVEQVRQAIIGQLRGRAVEPDVLVELLEVRSRAVVVNGEVRSAKAVPLLLGRERVLDVIGQAGGPTQAPFDSYVSISRGNTTRTALLQTLIDTPRENIYVRPEDSIYVSFDPRQFTAMGAIKNSGRHKFGTRKLTLLEATAIAGGFESNRANPEALFVFRYEYPHVVEHLAELGYISAKQFAALTAPHNAAADEHGRLPVVYRIDMTDPDNFFIAKRFPVRSSDTIYAARHGTVDFVKVVDLVAKARIISAVNPL